MRVVLREKVKGLMSRRMSVFQVSVSHLSLFLCLTGLLKWGKIFSVHSFSTSHIHVINEWTVSLCV